MKFMTKPNGLGAVDLAVAAEIRAEMGRQRLSVRRLAEELRPMSREQLSRRVNGDIPLTPMDLARIAEALTVPADELFARAMALAEREQRLLGAEPGIEPDEPP
jgi:transcriptional regulator with XRE-family HTH domain